jgi:hypothetical protein
MATLELAKIFETNAKGIISLWRKKIVVAAIKGNFNNWIKKNGWSNFVDRASIRIKKEINNTEEDYLNTNRRFKDLKKEYTQIALVQDFAVVNEPDLNAQEEMDICFSPDEDDIIIVDRYDEDIETTDSNYISKTTPLILSKTLKTLKN